MSEFGPSELMHTGAGGGSPLPPPHDSAEPSDRRAKRRAQERQAKLAHLEEEIATAAAQEDAATYRLLTAIRQFDEAGGWGEQGALSCAQWLSWRTHIGLTAARQKVRVAEALGRFPGLDEALRTGRVSYAKARAITRVITAENEATLLEMADNATGYQLERICRSFRQVVTAEQRLRFNDEDRWVSRSDTEGGMVRIIAQLHPEEAALVFKALGTMVEFQQDARQRRLKELSTIPPPPEPASDAASDAADDAADDAAIACRNGNARFGCPIAVEIDEESRTVPGPGACAAPPKTPPRGRCSSPPAVAAYASWQRPRQKSERFTRADGLVLLAEAFLSSPAVPASRRPAFELVVQVQRASLTGESNEAALLPDGMPISAEIARRLSCDAAHVEVETDQLGNLLDSGRRTRAISSTIQRALHLRDGGCRFPGCTHEAWLDGHHITPWSQGGKTRLGNLLSLCRRHHTAVHEGGFRLILEKGKPVFFDPRGERLHEVCVPHPRDTLPPDEPWKIPCPDDDGRRVDWSLAAESIWDSTFPRNRGGKEDG